jgi:hypothetical protein
MRLGFRPKLPGPMQALHDRVCAESACVVTPNYRGGRLISVWIEFAGKAAHLPSTSNGRQIAWNRGSNRPFVRKSTTHQARLEAMTTLYSEAILEKSLGRIEFGTDLIHVQAILAMNTRSFDSHNMTKPIGDWLQHIGMIENDSQLEIECKKRGHYLIQDSGNTTHLTIQPLKNVQELNERHIRETRLASIRGCGPLT